MACLAQFSWMDRKLADVQQLLAHLTGWFVVPLWLGIGQTPADERPPFGVKVLDSATGSGIPLVEVRTTDHRRYWSDNHGFVAIDAPDLAGREVYLHVQSDGYEAQADGFGYTGLRVRVESGRVRELTMRRTQVAERMGRLTGQGRFQHAQRLEAVVPKWWQDASRQIVGQDSSQAVLHGGRIHWFWGDTSLLRYPLGNFRTTGATSALTSATEGWRLEYFMDRDQAPLPMCPMFAQGTLVWLDGLVSLKDSLGRSRLVAHYSHRASLSEQLEHGLVVFNPAKEQFELLTRFEPDNQWQHLRGHPLIHRQANGKEYYMFGDVFYHVRVPRDWDAIQQPDAYESFGPLEAMGNRYGWRHGQAPMTQVEEWARIQGLTLSPSDAWMACLDSETQVPIRLHRGSVRWNPYLESYLLIANQLEGRSMLGEVWLGIAPSPEGPWHRLIKVATHERMSYYNPVHREFWDEEGGRRIYFEGTYTTTFSGHDHPVPGYEYNQLLYKVDLEHAQVQTLIGDQ